MNNSFFAVHRYAWMLEMAGKLLESPAISGQEASKVEYQISTRIYNNALCGMIRNGYPFASDSGNGGFLSLSIDGKDYRCPLNSVKNILRDEYEMIFDCMPEAPQNILQFPKNKEENTSVTIAEGQQDISGNKEMTVVPGCDLRELERPMGKKEISDSSVSGMLPKTSWLDFDFADSKPAPQIVDIGKNGRSDESMDIPIADAKEVSGIEMREIVEPIIEPTSLEPLAINPGNIYPVSNTEESVNVKRGLFTRRRGVPETPSLTVVTEKAEESSEEKTAGATLQREPQPQRKKGFVPRGPIEQHEAEPVVIGNACSDEAKKTIISEVGEKRDYSQDGGELFQHMHRVTLQKMYGSNTSGPYRFVLWPIRLLEKFSGKAFADFLLHVTDPNGNEFVYCTDANCKELSVKVDGKEFNVFGTWVYGELETHVTLRGKTASMFTIEDDIHIITPKEPFDDKFFEQFRLERKGQPKHFIVPFKDNNRGEYNIPIIGYVEVNRKIYPLERREGNTLRYKISGSEKVIAGHWEENRFTFTVDAANRIV